MTTREQFSSRARRSTRVELSRRRDELRERDDARRKTNARAVFTRIAVGIIAARVARRGGISMTRASINSTTLVAIRAEIANADAATRAQAIEALACLADTRGLVVALRSPHPYVRRTAVRGLASVAGVVVTWRLARLAGDVDDGVRAAVAQALTGRSSRLARRTLRRMATDDPAPPVRFLALVGLEQVDAPGIDALLAAVGRADGDGDLAATARALLRRRARSRGRSR
jgi:hypothetical protein